MVLRAASTWADPHHATRGQPAPPTTGARAAAFPVMTATDEHGYRLLVRKHTNPRS